MPLFGKTKDPEEEIFGIDEFDDRDTLSEQDDPPNALSLPILPLRGVVVYPMMWLPLTVGQERSIRLIDEALVDAEPRIIGLFTSKDAEKDEPGPDEIYDTGTMAVVHRMLRAPDGTIRLIVQGLERIRVQEFLQSDPYLRANVLEHPDLIEDTVETEALMRNAQDQFRQFINLVPHLPEELEMAALNVEDARQLVYLCLLYTSPRPRD